MKRNFNKFGAVILAAVLISFTMLFPAAAAQPDIPIPEDKIDPALLARMGAAENGKTIPDRSGLKISTKTAFPGSYRIPCSVKHKTVSSQKKPCF